MSKVTEPKFQQMARKAKELLATFVEKEDLIQFGNYQIGSDLRIDEAIQKEPSITEFLKQDSDERANLYDSRKRLETIIQA